MNSLKRSELSWSMQLTLNTFSKCCTYDWIQKEQCKKSAIYVLDLLGRKRKNAARKIAYQKNGAR